MKVSMTVSTPTRNGRQPSALNSRTSRHRRVNRIQIRDDSERMAMGWQSRWKRYLDKLARRWCTCCRTPEVDRTSEVGVVQLDQTNIDSDEISVKQYRIYGDRSRDLNLRMRFNLLSQFLAWSFRASFAQVIFTFLICYMSLIIIFSVIIFVDGRIKPECFGPEDILLGNKNNKVEFFDAFALSWTTFSTVGYGNIHPSLGHRCGFLAFLCATEAFIGVLYAGFSGAILFGKVVRVQARAPVLFSSCICVLYEVQKYKKNTESIPTNTDTDTNIDLEAGDTSNNRLQPSQSCCMETKQERTRCPVLEFRLVNSRCNEDGGEILDASINCMVSLNAKEPSSPSQPTFRKLHTKNGLTRLASFSRKGDTSDDYSVKRMTGDGPYMFDECNGAGDRIGIPKTIFKELQIEISNHPFFQRVWYIRHRLDYGSPLVSDEVKALIKQNSGYWPGSHLHHTSIRDSIKNFNELIVSLNGVSNDSASSTYTRKIYTFGDLCIGYKFANILYRDLVSNKVKVDLDLIDDIREIDYGFGEPFESFMVESPTNTASTNESQFHDNDDNASNSRVEKRSD